MKIERFEDIEAWEEARNLVNVIYDTLKEGLFSKDFSLRNQIRGASVSVMSNIAEGFDRGTNREFIQFLIDGAGCIVGMESVKYCTRSG
jgi:four helix bundle protein